jgi:hypothetical protein
MANRISIKALETLVSIINKETNNPETAYTKNEDGTYSANIGCYTIGQAYGGVSLEQICTTGGGVKCPLGSYHRPKRELYNELQAFRSGLEVAK